MEIPILRYPLTLSIEKGFYFIYGQSFSTFEGGDVHWAKVTLPIKDTSYNFQGNKNIPSIKNEIMCLSKYNGTWVSLDKESKLLIYFNPKKYTYIAGNLSNTKEDPYTSVIGLLNISLPKFKFKSLTCEIFSFVEDLKKKERNKIKNRILDYYNKRNFSKLSSKTTSYSKTQLPEWIKFQPIGDFIAQNYYDLGEKRSKVPIKLLDVLDLVKDEQLYFSPFMTLKEEVLHCNTIYHELKKMILQFPLRKPKLKELKHFTKQMLLNFEEQIYGKDLGPLDLISWKALKLGLNLSKLIYNYQLITSTKERVKQGLYVFFKSGTAIGFIHSLRYTDFRKISSTEKDVNITKWAHYDELHLVSNTHFQKIKPFSSPSGDIKIDEGFKNDKNIYLVQLKDFKLDFVRVNTTEFPFTQGSSRINCLCNFSKH